MFWDDEGLRKVVAEYAAWHLSDYDGYSCEIERVDFAVGLLLHTFGGLYVDMDREALRAPFEWFPAGCVSLAESPDPEEGRFQASLLASPKGHPFWEHHLREVARRTALGSGTPSLRCGHLDATVGSWQKMEHINVLPSEMFNPPISAIDAFEGPSVITRHFLTGVWMHSLDRQALRLFTAAKAGDVREAEAALRDGADPNAADSQGFTALHHASIRDNLSVAELLLMSRADVDRCTLHGMAPLHFAALALHSGSVCQLLAHQAKPSVIMDHVADVSPMDLAEEGSHYLQKDLRPTQKLLNGDATTVTGMWRKLLSWQPELRRIADGLSVEAAGSPEAELQQDACLMIEEIPGSQNDPATAEMNFQVRAVPCH